MAPAAKKQKTRRSARMSANTATSTSRDAVEITPEDAAQQLSEAENDLTLFDAHAATVISEVESSTCSTAAQADSSVKSEMGVIEKIYCENFMCHRKLRVTLSPHINFITGENGSGKSAIIAAIQICFGASARATHRGDKIKSLIRHGFDGNALVRVTLRNNDDVGGDAFHPEHFGRKIIVERLIRQNGSAEYRLKDERGLVVSKLKSDLDAIADHLNIQTDNPCVILGQENAKLFLKGTSEDKYKFFLQATDLDKMRATYAKIDEETRTMEASVLKREMAKIEMLKDAMKKATQQWQEAQSIGKLEEAWSTLKAEKDWSFVHEKDMQVAIVEKKMSKKQIDAEHAAREYARAQQQVNNLENKQHEANGKLQEVDAHKNENSQRKTEVKKRIREARRPLHTCKAEMKNLIESKQRVNHRLERLQQDLQKKRESHEAILQKCLHHNHKMRERIETKRREVQDIEQELNATTNRSQSLSQELEHLDTCHVNCIRQLREADGEAGEIQHQINSLQTRKCDSLAAFGRHTSHLQELIDVNLHQFTAPPIGPLGKFVTLSKEFLRFAVAIEVALKGALGSYLVVNGRDKALLDDLKRQVGCPLNQANIIISQRTGRRYENLEVPVGNLAAHVICNILEVSNVEVFNALVDICNSESKLLFDERETAEKSVLRGRSGNFRMAHFVSEVYLPSGDKFLVRNGNLAYIANKRTRRRPIICEDVEVEIQQLKQKLAVVQTDIGGFRRDESQLTLEMADLHQYVKQQRHHIDELSGQYNRHLVERQILEKELFDEQQEHTLDASVLDNEVRVSQEELESFQVREQELDKKFSVSSLSLEGPLRELKELEKEENQLDNDLNELLRDANAVNKQLRDVKADEIMSQRDMEASQASVTQLQQKLESAQEDCEAQTKKARQFCARPADIHPHRYYKRQIKKIQGRLDQMHYRLNGLSLTELKDDMELKEARYKSKKTNFDKFHNNLVHIRAMLKERKQIWQRFRKAISYRTSASFNDYMTNSNLAGKLKFRHDDERLEVAVLHNEKGASRASQMTDMKELSGGERSFTQVSLLLALGKSTECPFRIMDEFDVFMDAVNRDMTVKLLVEAAKTDAKKQFIFVTPNDLSTLGPDPMVKVQKMNPPRDRASSAAAMDETHGAAAQSI